MARARWLRPEFFTDAKVCQIDDQAALVFGALWVEADDGGVAPGDPRDIYGRRFLKRERHGWTVATVERSLAELAAVELAVPFAHRGERFVLIPDFAKKQGIKPKLWRHLGADHDAVVQAVLAGTNAGIEEGNGGGRQENAVLLPSTPKPIAVSSSQSHKPEPQLKPLRSAAAQATWNELIRQVPEAYRDGITGLVRASGDPEAVVASLRHAGPDGVNQCTASWETLGRAVVELRAAGGGFSPLRLAAFCRKIDEAPANPEADRNQGDWMRRATEDERRRAKAP